MTLRGDIRTLVNESSGSAGIATYPSGAAPGNGVSIAEGVRFISEAITSGAAFSQTVDPGGTARASVELVLADLGAMLAGSAGITTYPAAAAAGNGVSLAEVIRYISDTQLGSATAQERYIEKQHTSPLTTGNIFTFAGTIEILALWGRVTTAVQAQATTIKLSVVNDALTAYDLGTTVDGNAAAVGTLLSLPAAAGSAHVLTANGVLNPTQASRIIATCTTSGVIKATYGAASTGAILYQMLWRPLSSGATVAAA